MTTTRSKLTLTGVMAEHARNKVAPGILLPPIHDHLLKTFSPQDGRDPTVIHPSEMAKADWCLLGTYRRIKAGVWPEERFDRVRENIFEEGTTIHEKWQARIRAVFPLWGNWKCYRCKVVYTGLEPSPEFEWAGDCISTLDWHDWRYDEVHLDARATPLGIYGHADAGFDNTLVEIKSVGIGTVRKDAPDLLKKYQDGKLTDLQGLWNAIRRPLGSHLIQGDIYLGVARELGLPFTQIVYLYECKWHQMSREFTIQYNEERSEKLLAKARAVMYALESGIPPECIKKTGCKQCEAFPTVRRTVARTRDDI
jgi:hypothetical protein